MAIDMSIDLFGGNPKETEFFKAIRDLSTIAEKQGVKIKQLTVFFDEDGIAAQLSCKGEVDKIFEIRKIIQEK